MQDFEKLGVFYLGGRTTRHAARRTTTWSSTTRKRPGDARRLRRHDRQRQDRPLHRPARRGGDRRHPGDRDRPQGGPVNLLLTFPELRPEDFAPWIDAGRGGAGRGSPPTSSPRSRPRPGRRGWPTGARTARGSQRLRDAADSRIYTPGSDGRAPDLDLSSRSPRPRRGDRRRCRGLLRERVGTAGREPARPPGHRRRPDPEPRAHPAGEHPRPRLAERATTSTSRR